MRLQLANIPNGTEKRDAVHVAVIALQASHPVLRGERIALNVNGTVVYTTNNNDYFGVVDPFSPKNEYRKGEWFLCLVKPGTTQNLRHEWDHEALPAPEIDAEDDYDDGCRGCD